MLSEAQRQALNANLPTDKIREREGPGGRMLSYVEGWDAIAVLNEVVGAGSWGYLCDASIACPLEEKPGKYGPQWCITYVCRCTLTITGCEPIADYGVGHGKEKDPGLAVESAIKEAATDALKRCAKSLGMRLGLALYDKKREHVGPEVPPKRAMMTVDWVLADCETPAELAALVGMKRPLVSLRQWPSFKSAVRARAFDLGCPEKVDAMLGTDPTS